MLMEENQIFVDFTVYIMQTSVCMLILCGLQRIISCLYPLHLSVLDRNTVIFHRLTTILLIFLCLEGLLFTLSLHLGPSVYTFTAFMFGTQILSTCHDETEMERLKSQKLTWEQRLH